MMPGEKSDYPGLQFVPPPGSLAPEETEGEALVQWRKIGDRFTIVAFNGKPIENLPENGSAAGPTAEDEIDMAAMQNGPMM